MAGIRVNDRTTREECDGLELAARDNETEGPFYMGARDDRGVVVNVDRRGRVRELLPGPSRRLRNHSPDGFEWGYSGSGPAQLALAILLDFFDCETTALRYYQGFKEEVIATLKDASWEITPHTMRAWVDSVRKAKGEDIWK